MLLFKSKLKACSGLSTIFTQSPYEAEARAPLASAKRTVSDILRKIFLPGMYLYSHLFVHRLFQARSLHKGGLKWKYFLRQMDDLKWNLITMHDSSWRHECPWIYAQWGIFLACFSGDKDRLHAATVFAEFLRENKCQWQEDALTLSLLMEHLQRELSAKTAWKLDGSPSSCCQILLKRRLPTKSWTTTALASIWTSF